MSTRVDPRLAERRRAVAESNARRRLRRLVWVLVAGAVIGGLGWLAHSPWFAISRVVVSGVTGSDTLAILNDAGVVEGTPLITVGPRKVEERLVADPWVVNADVRLILPGTVEVTVNERTPVAWVQSDDRWAVVGGDATVLRYDTTPGFPRAEFEVPGPTRGNAYQDERVIGSLSFFLTLPPDLQEAASMGERDGEIWARVQGYAILLGLPTEMDQKASALVAMLAEGLESGTTINLVAPSRPAVVED